MRPRNILPTLALPVALAAASGCSAGGAEVEVAMAAKRLVTALGECGCEVEGVPMLAPNGERDAGFVTTEEGAAYQVFTYEVKANCEGVANVCADNIGTTQVFPYIDTRCGFGPGYKNPDGVRRATVTCY